MQLKDLKPNKKNPRRITQEQKDSLKRSLDEFGDLGGIVFNEQTKNLVGGHQRRDVLQSATIKIVNKYDPPTKTGTIADGFATIDGEKFSYRIVDWDKKKEMEALISANKNQGSWDQDLLKLAIADIPGINLELAGFSIPEIASFNIPAPKPEIARAEQSDEQYIAQEKKTEEQIPTENISAVEKTEEKAMDVIGKRFVIIIDCQGLDHKASLKEKIHNIVVDCGGKFF